MPHLKDNVINYNALLNACILLILLIQTMSCTQFNEVENGFLGNFGNQSGIYLSECGDSILILTLSYSYCDTLIRSRYSRPIKYSNKDSITFLMPNNLLAVIDKNRTTPTLILKRDKGISQFDEIKLKDFKDFTEFIDMYSNYESESFRNNELDINQKLIEELYSKVTLDEYGENLIEFIDSIKLHILVKYLNVDTTKNICWRKINLNKTIIFPKYHSKGNMEVINIRLCRNYFLDYMITRVNNNMYSKYKKGLTCHLFLNENLDLKNYYIETGDLLNFYDDLIIEILSHNIIPQSR